MKIIHINSVCFGSTGDIAKSLCKLSQAKGDVAKLCVPNSRSNRKSKDKNTIIFGTIFFRTISRFFEKITGNLDLLNYLNTFFLIGVLKRERPDVIHLHNLHGSYVNFQNLFKYVKKKKIRVVWTLHDCWSITGRCPHFVGVNCNKWKTGCDRCSFPKQTYPSTFFNKSSSLLRKKITSFSMVEDMTIVTPSLWLSNVVTNSFLGQYSIKVINNGIDLSIFKPTVSDFKKDNRIGDKHIVLGVSSSWSFKKGIDVFNELANRMTDDYVVVLVGTNKELEMTLSGRIVSIHRTQNKIELAKIYSAADVFLNPTREDTFPTVNMEALACGCPVITFDTGGSVEIVDEETGVVLKNNNWQDALNAIVDVCKLDCSIRNKCCKRARNYDYDENLSKYLPLYKGELD